MNVFRLGAALLADAACTIATGGVYLATRSGYDSTSFTQDEFEHQRQLDNFKTAVNTIKAIKKDGAGSDEER